MGCHDIEKSGFRLGIPKLHEQCGIVLGDVHRLRISGGTPGAKEKNRCLGLPCREWRRDTRRARAPTRGSLPPRPARRLSAACDAGRARLWLASAWLAGGIPARTPLPYREAKKSTNVRDEIEKSFDSKIRIFDVSSRFLFPIPKVSHQ